MKKHRLFAKRHPERMRRIENSALILSPGPHSLCRCWIDRPTRIDRPPLGSLPTFHLLLLLAAALVDFRTK